MRRREGLVAIIRSVTLDRDAVIRRFASGDSWFDSSPLYQVLSRTVAADGDLLDLAAQARPGQQPPNMLMAAAHLIVLEHPDLPFARFFPSVRGDRAEPPEAAGAEFGAFCAEHRDTLTVILRERLVQTNAPGRGVAVRLAMHEVFRRVRGPVTFLEIGPSAGIQLRFERWAAETGGRRFGPRDAPLTLRTEWRGSRPPPDLDRIPPIRDRLGVDLHPVDATDPRERRWLQALVWPEHRDRLAGLGRVRRLLHVSLELPPRDSPHERDAALLALRDSEDADRDLARVEGHGRWIQPLP